jgi:drug/metabolite transporter (DMT)-like permease
MREQNLVGNITAFISAVLFGASVIATRAAVASVPPLRLAFFRFGQGGLILIFFLIIYRADLLRVKLRDLPYIALLGMVLFSVFPVTFNAGLKFTEASRGALMLATLPLWSAWLARLTPTQVAVYLNLNPMVAALLGAALLAEKLSVTFAIGFEAVLTGVLLVNWPTKLVAEALPDAKNRVIKIDTILDE